MIEQISRRIRHNGPGATRSLGQRQQVTKKGPGTEGQNRGMSRGRPRSQRDLAWVSDGYSARKKEKTGLSPATSLENFRKAQTVGLNEGAIT